MSILKICPDLYQKWFFHKSQKLQCLNGLIQCNGRKPLRVFIQWIYMWWHVYTLKNVPLTVSDIRCELIQLMILSFCLDQGFMLLAAELNCSWSAPSVQRSAGFPVAATTAHIPWQWRLTDSSSKSRPRWLLS